jgi:HD-GYP domain-containing protein (c-di-GMP phosphodiesterase class II)
MAIVDTYDALINDRPYRAKKTREEAVEIIKQGRGTHFDPDLVDVFLECERKL